MPAILGPGMFILWGMVVVAFVIAMRQPGGCHRHGLRRGINMFLVNGPRIVMALLMAGFVSQILPKEIVGAWLGEGAGWQGILIGCVVGPFFPGGPLIIMPLVLALLKAGAGVPSVIALLTSASVWGLHRILMFEIPMMGGRFASIRFLSSLILPPLAGAIAAILTNFMMAPTGYH